MATRRSRRPKDQLPATHTLVCAHCHKDFVPIKRGTQKFCSGSCRSTHSKQKKAGTLGKFTSLPGPARGLGFLASTAAAGLGAAGANALEYALVTRHLERRSKEHSQQLHVLTELMQHVLAQNAQLQQQVHSLSHALGVTPPVSEPLPLPETLAQALTSVPEPLPEAPTAEEQAIVELLQAALSASAAPELVFRPTRPRPPKPHTPD